MPASNPAAATLSTFSDPQIAAKLGVLIYEPSQMPSTRDWPSTAVATSVFYTSGSRGQLLTNAGRRTWNGQRTVVPRGVIVSLRTRLLPRRCVNFNHTLAIMTTSWQSAAPSTVSFPLTTALIVPTSLMVCDTSAMSTSTPIDYLVSTARP